MPIVAMERSALAEFTTLASPVTFPLFIIGQFFMYMKKMTKRQLSMPWPPRV